MTQHAMLLQVMKGWEGDCILVVYLPIFVGEVSDEVLENLCQARCQNSQFSYF